MQGWPRLGEVGLPEAKWHRGCPGCQERSEPEDCRWLPTLPRGHRLEQVCRRERRPGAEPGRSGQGTGQGKDSTEKGWRLKTRAGSKCLTGAVHERLSL